MIDDIVKSCKIFILCTIFVVFYNLSLHLIGQVFFADKANGSLIIENGKIKGSILLAQNFKSDKFFHARPQITTNFEAYIPIYDEELIFEIRKAEKALKKEYSAVIPFEMVAFSGSNLDPYISVQAAKNQVKRVAQATGIDEVTIYYLIKQLRTLPIAPFFEMEKINVTKLNYALTQEIKKVRKTPKSH
jgi:potassium-transporting ATPase KdpC subunit